MAFAKITQGNKKWAKESRGVHFHAEAPGRIKSNSKDFRKVCQILLEII